jgi:hypothetical protein
MAPWTLKPVRRQERRRTAHSERRSSRRTRSARTSRPNSETSRDLSIRRTLQKRPARIAAVEIALDDFFDN